MKSEGSENWLLYGPGYTGKLILEEAVGRRHKPAVAGRDEKRVREIAEKLGLRWYVLNLDNHERLKKVFENFFLVLNAAGPFIYTHEPVLNACIETKTHYLDITGEIPVFINIFSKREIVEKRGICAIPGTGFDVVPTDCLAKYLSERMEDAVELELAFTGLRSLSPGTLKTMIEMLPQGGLVRRKGILTGLPPGRGIKKIKFPHGEFLTMPLPWGDLETAYRSTGIPNITTYMAFPSLLIKGTKILYPLLKKAMQIEWMRRLTQKIVEKTVSGPDEEFRMRERSFLYGCVKNKKGRIKETWMELPEVYRFTALSAVRCVEKVFNLQPAGTLTPSLAFGADFVLEIEGVKRYESLPESPGTLS